MISFYDLHNLLRATENLFSTTPPSGFPSAVAVRKSKTPVQGFGLHQLGAWNPAAKANKSDQTTLRQIVVAVGGNYTQGSEDAPRDHCATPPAVLDDLEPWRRQFLKAFAEYSKNPSLWVDRCAASSASLGLHDAFHFVMSNFCIWITEASWQNTASHVRADLLLHNPPFAGTSGAAAKWPHLDRLADELSEHDVLWVGHGKDCEVFTLFREWAVDRGITKWMLLPNLSYHYGYYGKHHP